MNSPLVAWLIRQVKLALAVANAAQASVSSAAPNLSGTVTPEGNVAAPVGSRYFRTDTEQDFVKKTGTGNTGWV